MKRLWTIVAYVSFVLGIIGMAARFNFSDWYAHNSPTSADAQTGRVHPHNSRGKTVYLDENELLRLRLADGVMYVGLIGFLVGGRLGGVFDRKK